MTDLYKLSLHHIEDRRVPHELCYGTLDDLKAFVKSESVWIYDYITKDGRRLTKNFREGGPLEMYDYPWHAAYIKIDSVEHFKEHFNDVHPPQIYRKAVQPNSRRVVPLTPEFLLRKPIPWYTSLRYRMENFIESLLPARR